jgi:8-oxo-dGTP pyrophosphatase MutT (NUDIX family)/N-acetylglutamate synthase-like GNAT family acetyltransferase
MRFDLVRERVAALPRELPAPPAILTPVRLDSSEDWIPGADRGRGRPAAVLALLFPDAEGQARVLLTARTRHLSSHAGEISFPGGSADEGDADPIATALREADEEVGLDPIACGLRVTGGLEVFALTVSGYLITPVVAIAERRPDCRPAPDEVARIIEAPVEAFLPDAPVVLEEQTIRERLIRYGVYPVEGERVWGATARMLGQLGAALAAEPEISTLPLPGDAVPAGEPWQIRPAGEGDGPAIATFLERLAPELSRSLASASDSLVAETAGRIAGLASWAPWDRARTAPDARGFDGLTLDEPACAAELTLLAVLPTLRGRGIGHGLTDRIAGASRAAGCDRLLAWTLSDSAVDPSSVSARAFFRSNGFTDLAVDRQIQAFGRDRLLLTRPLA